MKTLRFYLLFLLLGGCTYAADEGVTQNEQITEADALAFEEFKTDVDNQLRKVIHDAVSSSEVAQKYKRLRPGFIWDISITLGDEEPEIEVEEDDFDDAEVEEVDTEAEEVIEE